MQNSAMDSTSTTIESTPSSPQYLPTDKPQSDDTSNPSLVQNDGESRTLVAVVVGDAVEKPMVEVISADEDPLGGSNTDVIGHKRKPSKEIESQPKLPTCPICETKFLNKKSVYNHMRTLHPKPKPTQHVTSPPPISSSSTGQQLHDQSVHHQVTLVEGGERNEKGKGNEDSPTLGLEGLDLEQQPEELKYFSDHVAQETGVEPLAAHEIEVKSSVVQEIEIEPSSSEKNEVEPSAVDELFVAEKNEVEPFVAHEIEATSSVAQEIDMEPFVAEKNEVELLEVDEHYGAENNEVEPFAPREIEVKSPVAQETEMEPSITEKNVINELFATEKNEVEPFAAHEIEVKSSVAQEIEMKPSAAEKNETKPSVIDELLATEKNEVESFTSHEIEAKSSVAQEIEMESSTAEKNEMKPSAVDEIEVELADPTEKYDVKPSAIGKNEVESSLTKKNDGVRDGKTVRLFDLNELPADDDEEEN